MNVYQKLRGWMQLNVIRKKPLPRADITVSDVKLAISLGSGQFMFEPMSAYTRQRITEFIVKHLSKHFPKFAFYCEIENRDDVVRGVVSVYSKHHLEFTVPFSVNL